MRHSGRLCKSFRACFGLLVIFSAYVLLAQRAESAATSRDKDSTTAGHGVVDRVSTVVEDVWLNDTHSPGSFVEAPAEKALGEEAATDTHSPGSFVGAPAERALGEESVYLLEGNEEHGRTQRTPKLQRRSSPLSTIFTVALSAALIVMVCLIGWDVMNFVGDVPDPFEDVADPRDIPNAIEQLLSEGKSLAFVVRKCKYCGRGIRAMKKAGKDPVIVMVEGHPHQRTINRYLKSQYGVKGFPFFFLDRDRRGYLSQIKEYSQNGTSTGMP